MKSLLWREGKWSLSCIVNKNQMNSLNFRVEAVEDGTGDLSSLSTKVSPGLPVAVWTWPLFARLRKNLRFIRFLQVEPFASKAGTSLQT